jgi:type IV pilus biogenesis protein PilP
MHNANPVRLLWLLCFTAAISHSCLAAGDPFSAGDDNVTIGQLEAIQARNFLLEQQVQTAKLKRQLRESENDAGGLNSPNSPTPMPFIPANPAGEMPAKRAADSSAGEKTASGAVRLQEIYGRGTQLRARILLPQGGVTEVTTGDQIPGTKLRVSAVTAAVVKLSDGSELSF